MYLVAVTFLHLIATTLCLTDVTKALWKSTALDVSSITAGAHVEVTAPSEFLCAARALQQLNSSLYCFAGDRCVVSLTTERGPTGSPVPDPWTCKCMEPTSCPAGFELVGCVGCFHFSIIIKLIDDAKTECQNMGASLASPSVLSEYDAVREHIVRRKDGASRYAVDLRRLDDTDFMWGDGSLLSSAVVGARPWGVTEPANIAGEGCGVIASDRNFYLADYPCVNHLFICRA